MQPEIAERIRKLVSSPLDWNYVFAEASSNSLVPLLHRNLSAVATDLVPPAQMDALTMAARANTARSLLLTAETVKVTSALLSAGVRALPYKGAVLAAQAYGDVALRQFEDVDIVLRHAELPKAHEVMLGLGYRPKYPWTLSADVSSSLVPGDYNYCDDERETMVELHTERSMRHFPLAPDFDVFMRRLDSVLLSGHEIKTFAAEDALLILCIHGSKHLWERISWIVDISEMIQSHPGLDWDEVFSCADSFLGGRMLRVGLGLAGNLLGTPLPADVASRVQKDGVAIEIAAEIGQRQLRRDAPQLGAAARFRLRRQNGAGWAPGMALCFALGDGTFRRRLGDGALAGGACSALHCAASDQAATKVWQEELGGLQWPETWSTVPVTHS